MHRIHLVGAASIALLVTFGCTPLAQQVAEDTKAIVGRVRDDNVAPTQVKVVDAPYIAAVAVDYQAPPRGAVTLRGSLTPLNALVSSVADSAGLSVSYATGVAPDRKISVDLKGLAAESAIRELAFAAGYVAVLDRPGNVTIAERATYMFRVPPRLLQGIAMRYSVQSSGSGGGAGGGGAPAGPGASAGAGSSAPATATSVTVSGNTDFNIAGFSGYLQQLAGGEAVINIMADSGLVSVRGSGQQLKRIERALESYVRDSMASVDVQISIIEVSLTREFQFGIDWAKVVPLDRLLSSGANAAIAITNAGVVRDAGFNANITTRSISSVVQALEQWSNVKVVSQPRVIALNHSPAIFRDALQRPYVGQVQTTVSGTAGTAQNSAQISFAMDGVSLSVRPNILDNQRVELTVIPQVSTVSRFEEFNPSRDTRLTAPNQPVKEAHLQILAEHGKTIIIGGSRQTTSSDAKSGVPFAKDVPVLSQLLTGQDQQSAAKEIVMLVHAKIMPAPRFQLLTGEAL